ncbi:DUF378 domain-containing protein [Peribacillus frigoritolerans]|uniref:DUF378 domain-containing protein n=1 Tax=Peribacillus frigoritolerans TaxID=450367 RepID=UPI003F7EBAF4
MSGIQRIALVLTIIGAINWGLIGFFQFDLVASIFGGQDAGMARIVYGLVGIAGLINLGLLFKSSPEISREPETKPTR